METVMAVGGWFAKTVIESSIGTLTSSALEQFKLDDPVMNDALLSLNTSLSKANAILDISHKMKAETTHLNCLLKQLKEAAYDAGDMVDDLKYEELKKRVEDGGGDHSNKRKRNHDATSKIREVQKRLDEIAAAIEQVVSISSSAVAVKEMSSETYRVREESSSFLLDPEVFGRAEDQKRLTELLLEEDEGSQSSNNLFVPVISLVGMGGIGKTTLSQWAYSKLEEKFEEKIWICASDPFDVNRLTREIVQSVDNDKEYSPLTKLDKLQQIVKKQLAQKRFLLVIDDVWNEDRRKWETFYAPLRLGAPGSKILVTTRSHDVASIINSEYTMRLDGLPEDRYYSFFNICAFGKEDPKKYGRMEAIGRNIAARLKGLPLAAKTLGSLLNSHFNEDYWKNIQDSEIWDIQQGDNDIMSVLKLSFDNLSSRLKPCFAYCSLFPKDYKFEKDIIVQMWMSHDFIVPEANLRMEDVGYRYFNDLFSRCLFEKSLFGSYVMHDLLHDLAQSISKDECVRLEYGKPQDIPSTVRHLSVCVPYPELNITDICKHRKLRTILFVSNRGRIDVEFSVELEDLLSHLTYVRVLVLEGWFLKGLPDSIGKLKQLRYLDIRRTKIYSFPESLCFLYNLQRFKVPYATMSYPKRMENLVNLREIPTRGAKFICQVADVGRLICVQELGTFNIEKESGHKMEELQKLTELGGRLCIQHLESIDRKEEAMKAKLKDKKYLRELSLSWAFDRPAHKRIDVSDVQVLEGLQPHPNLEELSIENYSGIEYPSWLESQLLSNLTTIHLKGCRNMEKLPPLGQLPSLKLLELEDLHAVKRVGEEFYGTRELKAFVLLEKLVLKNMLGWEEWSPAYSSQLFPCLKEIVIQNCPKLKDLPFVPPVVVKLVIIGLDVNEFPPLGHLSCLEDIVIRNCRKLKVLPLLPPTVVRLEIRNMELNEFSPLGHLVGLKILRFRCLVGVRKIEDLFGAGELKKGMPSLEEFQLVGMPELEEWSGVCGSQFFSCLTKLVIKECPELRNLPCLPPSLKELRLYKVGLDALLPVPVSWVSQESSSSSRQNIASLLHEVHIESCPNLKTVEEWLLQNRNTLEKFGIIDCAELTSLAIERLKDFTCLKELTLKGCPKLTTSAAAGQESILFPSSLRELELGYCGGDLERPLLLCLRGAAPSLTDLTIRGSSYRHIISLPGEFFHHLTTLKILRVEGLTELRTLESLQHFTTLWRLEIINCPQLKALPEDGLPTTLRSLDLSNCHPDLKERCQKDTGDDWPKIAHIRNISFDRPSWRT